MRENLEALRHECVYLNAQGVSKHYELMKCCTKDDYNKKKICYLNAF